MQEMVRPGDRRLACRRPDELLDASRALQRTVGTVRLGAAGASAADCLLCLQVVLRDGMLCQEQDSLPGGISRESSMCERREPGEPTEPSLAKALKDDWLGGPASHPLQEQGGAAEVAADDGSDEYEGAGQWAVGSDVASLLRGAAPRLTLTTGLSAPPSGAASAGASSEEYSDVGEQGGQDTEVVYLRVSLCGAGRQAAGAACRAARFANTRAVASTRCRRVCASSPAPAGGSASWAACRSSSSTSERCLGGDSGGCLHPGCIRSTRCQRCPHPPPALAYLLFCCHPAPGVHAATSSCAGCHTQPAQCSRKTAGGPGGPSRAAAAAPAERRPPRALRTGPCMR